MFLCNAFATKYANPNPIGVAVFTSCNAVIGSFTPDANNVNVNA